jgi:hypothetical protein
MVVLKQESEYAVIEGNTFSRVSSFSFPLILYIYVFKLYFTESSFISAEFSNGARLTPSAEASYFQPV